MLVDIPDNSPAFGEETFGPVAAVFRAGDITEAIGLANVTNFGLAAST